MSKKIDAIGKACPLPVVMTKKEMDHGEERIITLVDNKIAVENLKKLADSTGYMIEVKEEGDSYAVYFSKDVRDLKALLDEMPSGETWKEKEKDSDYVIFIGKNYIGEGDRELGQNLMRMYLYTLTESQKLPSYILLMNSGVKLPAEDDQAIEHLKTLKEKGVEILVCGACLNFYSLTEKLKVGAVSNMYDISGKMEMAGKVISFG